MQHSPLRRSLTPLRRGMTLLRRGMTLLEIMVAMMVAGILMLLVVRLFSVGSRVGHQEYERSAAETNLLLFANRLESDLQSGTPQGLSLATDGTRLAIHPIDQVSAAHQVVHEDRLVVWRLESDQLSRSEITTPVGPPFDGSPIRLNSAQLTALPAGTLLNRLEEVTAFRVENPTGITPPNVGMPLKLTLEVRLPRAQARPSVRLEREVVVRNSGR